MTDLHLSADPERAADVATLFKAMGHPVRLRILSVLASVEEAHVTGLMGCLELPQAAVSQQLRLLRAQGLVRVRRDAGFAWYRLAMDELRPLIEAAEKLPGRRR